ncbi:ATP synthase F1 subunit delta [Bacteroidetes bacterium endosymbiont of Geopemphigus sp.]|uniref:ATP synthase F1 subunit delta n=1 Tax=Bacteroidetes bacterium endosymbiont of Geopemphigus sp. TaxID=2047937 RepID=UPI000CD08197|nr:ATP synthase F1 subunit delta [Bacteroidetes bacterium endosymbiont of Geopemphigus sp.]
MQNFKTAKRYAKGLLDYSLYSGELDKVYDEMQQILNLIDQSREFYLFLKTPLLNPQKKRIILRRLFRFFSETTLKFLELISLHKRTSLLKIIAAIFLEIYKDKKRWENAILITATLLSGELESQILAKLRENKGTKRYLFLKKVDPTLMGGFILRIRDKEWNMSLSGKIHRLRQSLIDRNYVKNTKL